MAYSRPYIMDLDEMQKKLDGTHPGFLPEPITPQKLKDIIKEFVRLEAHCDLARALCEHNVGQIINGGTVTPYPPISIPST